MKNIFVLLLVFALATITAQNNPVVYGFDKIPKTLLLNPGAEPTYRYHIGLPMFSGLSAIENTTEITLADLFRDDGIGIFKGIKFNEKLQNAVNRLDKKDFIHINSQIEVLSGGYKINARDYLSVGYYSELDAFLNVPKDMFTLVNEGNSTHLNKVFSFSEGAIKAEAFGVLHAGISRRFNKKFTAGARIKMYSGSANITSTNNSGTFTTRKGTDNIYEHRLSDVNFAVNTSGVYNEEGEIDINARDAFKGTFFSSNLGLGLDFGLTLHLTEQIEVTASVLDIGFINYNANNRNRTAKGSYKFSGIAFEHDKNNSEDYWTMLKNDFREKVKIEENTRSYNVMRPLKINSSWSYSFGKSRNTSNCHDISFKDFYDSTAGAQLYTIFLPTGPKFALTGFYQYKLSKHLNTKVTYTVDDFSYSNIGLGVSANIWRINIYGALGNIFKLTDVATANTATVQFGVNYIVN